MPLANISKRIGHSQISTTLNIYTHQINKQDKIDDLKSIIKKSENNDILKALIYLKEKNILSVEEYNNKLKFIRP